MSERLFSSQNLIRFLDRWMKFDKEVSDSLKKKKKKQLKRTMQINVFHSTIRGNSKLFAEELT